MQRAVRAVLVVLLGVSITAASCQTGTAKDIGFRGWAVAHTSFMLTKSVEAGLVCGRAQAPAPPLCVDDETHGKILTILSDAATVDGDLGRAIQALPEGVPTTSDIGTMIGRVTTLVADVVALIPKSPQRQALADKVAPTLK